MTSDGNERTIYLFKVLLLREQKIWRTIPSGTFVSCNETDGTEACEQFEKFKTAILKYRAVARFYHVQTPLTVPLLTLLYNLHELEYLIEVPNCQGSPAKPFLPQLFC